MHASCVRHAMRIRLLCLAGEVLTSPATPGEGSLRSSWEPMKSGSEPPIASVPHNPNKCNNLKVLSAAKQALERLSVRPSLQLEEQKQEGMDGQKAGRREYEGMLRAVVADEVVLQLEEQKQEGMDGQKAGRREYTKGCYVLLWRTRLCTRWRGCSWIRMPRDSRMAVDYTIGNILNI